MAIVPASIRNRNPGAQYPGPSAKKFGSSQFETLKSKDGIHKIATFPSNVQGGAALFDLLATKKYCGMTVEKAIAKWCGAFYVSTYIKVLEEKGGVRRTDVLTVDLLKDPAKAIPLARAMAWQEAGRDYPMTEDEWMQAHACAFQQPVAPAFAPDNDVPSPKPETRLAAKVADVVGVAKVVLPVGVGSGVVATNAITTAPAPVSKTIATLPKLPKPPAETVEALAGWKGLVIEYGAFATSNPKLTMILVAVVAFGSWLMWPKREA